MSIFPQKQDCGGERRSTEKEVGSAKKEERSKTIENFSMGEF